MPGVSCRHAARTDTGLVRAKNEDAYFVEAEAGAYGVADGLGGHAAGEVASRLAVRRVAGALSSLPRGVAPEEAHEALRSAIEEANREIHGEARARPDLAGMGTTLTALFLTDGGKYVVGHVGDSRAYLLRAGELRRITRDHTYVQELVDRGRLTDEQARVHPRSSVLTRALGLDREVEVELHEGEVRTGDRFLLATDGLTGMLPEEELRTLLEAERPPEAAAELLVESANQAGGMDNTTVVVVDVQKV